MTGEAHLIQGDAAGLPLADGSVDLAFFSPPYVDARTYGINAQRKCAEWIDWMLGVVGEACRVSRGLVLVNCAGVTRKHCYWPAPEGLLYRWWATGGQCWRPVYWHRVGIPGSGGKQWLRADVEYVFAFKARPGPVVWADNTACGHVPKWGPGGEMSNRNADGARLNQWGREGSAKGFGSRRANGTHKSGGRPSHVQMRGVEHRADGSIRTAGTRAFPVKANPGNFFTTGVAGGGRLGSKLAHENEAPFPEALAEFFIKSFCPPGGIVLDSFSGSGTTVAVARRLGRIGIGVNLRLNQCELARRRLAEPQRTSRPKRRHVATPASPDQGELFAPAVTPGHKRAAGPKAVA